VRLEEKKTKTTAESSEESREWSKEGDIIKGKEWSKHRIAPKRRLRGALLLVDLRSDRRGGKSQLTGWQVVEGMQGG
jgi:hypothetical protein